MNALYVAAGGALGALSRYGISLLSMRLFPGAATVTGWLGTLLSNVLGAFLIGFLATMAQGAFPDKAWLTPLLIVGFCGGFTTFSSFVLDGYRLFEAGQTASALLYLLLSLILTFAALLCGFYAAGCCFK